MAGLDISDGMLRRALTRSGERANKRFVCGSAERIPFRDEFFTKIVSIEAFYYSCNQEQVLSELLRVTAPLGRLFLLICFYTDHPESLLTADGVHMPVFARSAAEYKQMAERAGWSEVQTEEFVRELEPGRKPDVHDKALLVCAKKTSVR